MAGRGFVIPDDVKAVATPVLAHRLSLTAQAWTSGIEATHVVTEVVNSVPGPPVVGSRERAASSVTDGSAA
jgi:MoxR-like ATPase